MNPHPEPGRRQQQWNLPPEQGRPVQPPSAGPPHRGEPPPGPPAGPPPPPGPPPGGGYGAGLLAVLVVITVLAGGTFLGGGLVVGDRLVSSWASPEPSPSPPPPAEPTGPEPTDTAPEPEPAPTSEPPEEPTTAPEDLLTADDLVAELRDEYDIESRSNLTPDMCTPEDGEEPAPFQCTSATDTPLVRVIAFPNAGAAALAAVLLQQDLEEGEADAVDVQEACHFVLVWFEEAGTDQAERDEIADFSRGVADCA